MWVGGGLGLEAGKQRSMYTSKSATPGRPPWTLRGRESHCWHCRISDSRWGSYPQCRPITSNTNVLWWLQERDKRLTQSSCPCGQDQAATRIHPLKLPGRCIYASNRLPTSFLKDQGDPGKHVSYRVAEIQQYIVSVLWLCFGERGGPGREGKK